MKAYKSVYSFAYYYIKRFKNGDAIYPIEAKYLAKKLPSYPEHYSSIVLQNTKHREYLSREQRNNDNEIQRKLRVYERVHKNIVFTLENNHIDLDKKPPIPVNPIIDRCVSGGVSPKDVLSCQGIYFLYWNGEMVYIGSSVNIYSRIKSHYWGNRIPFNTFKFIAISGGYLRELEYSYINHFLPYFNKRLK